MKRLLEQLENKIPFLESVNPEISTVSVGWHIDHSLKVIYVVSLHLKQSDANKYKWKFNWKRSFVYLIRKIPRGTAKSPDAVQPSGKIIKEDLNRQVQEGREQVEKFRELQPNQYIQHPVFGMLNAKQAKKFLEIHTAHHLKIIHDILSGKNPEKQQS